MAIFPRNRFLSYGVPFLVLLVGGSFGLKQFTQLRYTFRKSKSLRQSEVEGPRRREEEPTIENEYQRMKQEELEEYQNIRGPRPWEDSKTYQDEQRQVLPGRSDASTP